MGLFSRKEREETECAVCNEVNTLKKTKILDDELVCTACLKKTDTDQFMNLNKPVKKMTAQEIKSAIETQVNNKNALAAFIPTKKIEGRVEFDDNQKQWLVVSGIRGKRDKSRVYNYRDIVDFELLEDGGTVASGGLGRAAVGGILFGGAGAIVGGVTGKKTSEGICHSVKIKVTMNNMTNPVVYINFLETPMKKDGYVYKVFIEQAQECMSTLQLICNANKEPAATVVSSSGADEILKYKNLLDSDIITQEEFDLKKKELLGI